MSVYARLTPHESCLKLKLTSRAINVVSTTVLKYMRWSMSYLILQAKPSTHCMYDP
jgi:hypothetical protein